MADVNVTDLTQETYSTLDGTEQVIMFDSAEGKRATVAAVGEYVLKKLTTSLNGSTQTVANALSSLNSDLKLVQLSGTINVSSGTITLLDDISKYNLLLVQTNTPSGVGVSTGVVRPWLSNAFAVGHVFGIAVPQGYVSLTVDSTTQLSITHADANIRKIYGLTMGSIAS